MTKTATVRARMEPGLKRSAEAVLKKVGLTPRRGDHPIFRQVKLNDGLPFPVRIPNRKTQLAIREARAGKNLETFDTVADWARKMRAL